MRIIFAAAIVALSLVASGCSDYANSGGPVAPTPTPTQTPSNGIVTINIVRDNGAQSFSPNPATLPAGQMVVWHNVDGITHRVVLNSGSLDTGDLTPGASSQPMAINTGGAYHCSIHPSMVGTIVFGG
jgi:plastocyanin